jgi:hypothetical protein
MATARFPHFCYVSGKPKATFTIPGSSTATGAFRNFLLFPKVDAGKQLKTGHDFLTLYPSQFTICIPLSTRRYKVHAVDESSSNKVKK